MKKRTNTAAELPVQLITDTEVSWITEVLKLIK